MKVKQDQMVTHQESSIGDWAGNGLTIITFLSPNSKCEEKIPQNLFSLNSLQIVIYNAIIYKIKS